MWRHYCWVVLIACLMEPIDRTFADEKEPPKQTVPKEIMGRWITTKERKDGDKIRKYQLIVELEERNLKFFTEEDGKIGNEFTLVVTGFDSGDEGSRLLLDPGGSRKYTIHVDWEGDRMYLVGRLRNRPFEGFSLSGEYQRGEKAK